MTAYDDSNQVDEESPKPEIRMNDEDIPTYPTLWATGWSNGNPTKNGAGYGLRISKDDRDQFISPDASAVIVEMPNGKQIEVPLSVSFTPLRGAHCAENVAQQRFSHSTVRDTDPRS
jgi:hypothetical protein